MRTSQRRFRAMAAGLALLGAGACEKASARPATDDLNHDLAVAGAQNDLALSPTAGRTDVVSNIERSPAAAPRVAPSQQAPRRAPHAEVAPTPTPAPAPVVAPVPAPAPAASPTPEPDAPIIVAPRPAPRATQQRPGGYKSIGDVIRDAPFPINP